MDKNTLEFKSGVTTTSNLDILYASMILQPAMIYLSLVAGSQISALYVTIILFTEIAVLVGKRLTTQEVTIIFLTTSTAASSIFALGIVYASYMLTSPISASFGVAGAFPWWFPKLDSPALQIRSVLRPEWIPWIAVSLAVGIPSVFMDLLLGFFCYQLYVEQEDLPFPLQKVSVTAIETLSERKPETLTIFTLAAIIGGAYSFIVYGMKALPVPWVDSTQMIEQYFPGAMLGLATDIMAFASGFVIPFGVVIWQFIGSFALYFVGNALALKYPLPAFEAWQMKWTPGMKSTLLYQFSYLYLWMGPLIGVSVAAAIAPLISKPRTLINSVRALSSVSKTARAAGYISLTRFLLLYIIVAAVQILVAHWLVPGFPAWILILFIGFWSLIYTMINARAIGETGYGINIPYADYAVFMSSGYEGFDMWFLPSLVSRAGGSGWTANLKICKDTRTSPMSLYKAFILALAVSYVMSFFYMEMFWKLAPIPSYVYPWTSVTWPVGLISFYLFSTKRILTLDPLMIIGPAALLTVLGVASSFLHLPVSLIGLAAGCLTPLPFSLSVLMGAIAGRLVLRRLLKEWWSNNYITITAGLASGASIMISISTAVDIVIRSMLTTPF